jgi:hypothetical protein
MTGLPVHRDIPSGSRVSDRIKTTETATIHQGDNSFAITILDMGLEGFGAFSEHLINDSDNVILQIPDEQGGIESYICNVSFCRQESGGFHLGLKIVDREEDIIIIHEI